MAIGQAERAEQIIFELPDSFKISADRLAISGIIA
jgi:hypothetical protein